MPRRPSLALLSCLVTALTGCAFDDGRPWGELSLSLSATAPRSLRTADGVNVELDRVEVAFGGVAVFGEDDPAAAFDPADPPPGCTLCHGGHCHCGDALVSYAELAGQQTGAAPTAVLDAPAGATPVALGGEPTMVPLLACGTGCPVGRGTLTRAEVRLTALRVVGRTAEGVTFDGEVPLGVAVSAITSVPFERGETVAASLALRFTVPPSLFDGVAWPTEGTLALDGAGDTLRDNLATGAVVSATVDR